MIAHVLTKRTSRLTLARFFALVGAIVTIAVVLTASASADLDTFTTGDGHEGAVTVSTNSVLNYSAPLNAAAGVGATSLTTGVGQTGAVGTAATTGSAAQAQFEANRLALVIQTSNYTGPGATSGSQADIDLSSSSTGQWELARISSVTGSIAAGMTVNFANPLINSYSSTGAQIVAVPEFTTVQVNNTRSWSANAWNGTNGGITAFLATGTVNLNNANSSINANGDGFRGGLTYNGTATACTQLDGPVGGGKGEGIVAGVYPGNATTYASRGNIANGGGGGVCENSGGGGGGNGGQGGIGGLSYDGSRNVGGLGGTKLNYSAFDHAIFGGGGGGGDENNDVAGNGGNGGGFVFVRANSLTGSGSIAATGNDGADSANVGASDAGGGGGAGGVVYARFNTTAACGSVSVRGGNGGDELSTGGVHGPGGGGAGGRLVLQSSGGTCPSTIANGVGGTVPSGGGGNRGSGPTSSTDATSSGATEAVPGGGGITTPTAALSTPADNAITNDTTPTITGTSSMNAGTIRVYIDGAYAGSTTTAAGGTWSFTPSTPLTAGAHTYLARPVYYGLAGTSTASRTINIDLTPPGAPTVSSNRSGTVNANTATITYTPAEGGGTIQCSVDGGAYATCAASPISLTGLADGNRSYSVRQIDAAGNVGSASTVAWVVDTVLPPAPTVTRTSPASTPTSQTTAQIAFSANEAGGTLQCSVDGGAYATCVASPANLSSLTDGVHSYAVRHVDAAGNVGNPTTVNWTVDTVLPPAPTVTRTSPASSPTTQNTAQITFSANEAGGSLQCSVDGGAYATCAASPANLSSLTEGNHSYAVRQVDAAGNVGSAATVAWVVDATAPPAPTVTRTTPVSSPTSSTAAQITYSANEAGGTLQCSVDGGAYATCAASPATLGPLSDGPHSYSVRQLDTAGNISTVTTVNWTVDTASPPAPTLSSNRTGTTNLDTAQLTFSANEAGGTLECSVDGGAYATCAASPVNLSGLADGNHSYAVRQVDAAGNIGSSATVAWVVDTVAPPATTVTRTTPTSTPTSSTAAQITFSANEAGGTLECSVDGGAYSTCGSSPANLSGLADGLRSYAVRQIDAGGNNGIPTTVNWTVDTAPPPAPTVTRTTPASSPTSSDAAQIAFSANEAGGTLQCSVDGAAYATCGSSPANLSGLADGPHSYAVRQVDAAGNNGTPTTVNWTVDTAAPPAPTVTRTSPTTSPTSNTAAQITFSANEVGGTLECSIDGGAYAACAASPDNLSALTDGAHSYAVRQLDAAGNIGSVTSVAWVVDTATPPAPTVTRTSPASTPTNLTTAQIDFTANEAGGILECSVDGGAFATCAASPANLSGLAGGPHSYAVRHVDAAGNTSNISTVNWTIDLTPPPAPTVSSNRTGTTDQDSAQLTFSANEAGGTLECSADGGAYATCAASPVTLSGLADGNHSYAVRQVDAAGNTGSSTTVAWVVDTVAPPATTVTRTSPTSTPTSQTTAQITFSANEAGGTLECSVDGGAYAACGASPANLSGLTDGPHSYAVRQVDAGGNNGTPTTVNWTVDTSPPPAPTVTRTTPVSSPTSSTAAQISYSANEAGGTLECSLDGGSYATCGASPANLSGLADGPHSYAVRQVDAAGNTGTPASVSWTVDTIAPLAPTVSSNRIGTVNVDTALITYSAAEGGGTIQCSLDGGAYATCAASPVALSGLADGSRTYAVRQIDAAGNTGSATTVAWIIDTVAPPAPTVARTSPSSTPTNQDTAQIDFSANEAGGTLECSVDGGAYATCAASPANLSGLADGPHSYAVRQVDVGTNIGPATIVNWTVDTAAPPAPTVTRTSPTSSPTSETAAQIAYSANEAGGTLECSVDGGPYATCGASPANLAALADGNHSYAVRQVDAAGNTGTVASVSWVVDTTPPPAPTVTRSSPVSSPTTDQTAQIAYSANEAGGTLECSIDGGAYSTCGASPANLSGLAEGNHTYAVRQVDGVGNIGSVASVAWVVDTTAPPAPTVTRTSPAATPTSQTTAQVTFSANEAGGTLECSVDGGAYSACAVSPANLSGLADGAHSYAVRQLDAAGNFSSDSSVSWTVDTLAPAAPTVSSNRSGTVSESTASITYTAAEGGGTMQCSVDGGAFATCAASPVALSGLGDGPHSYAVRQVDAANNVGADTTVSWTVDTVAPPGPTVTRTSPATTPTSQTTAQIDFSANEAGGTLECSVDGGSFAACGSSPANLSGLTDGAHSYAVRQVDSGGNIGAATTVNWTVDTSPPPAPTVIRTSPTSSPTTQTSAQITFSANEAGGTLECSVDGGAFATCAASPTILSALSDGAHSYAVRQVDVAGNTGSVSSVAWVVDTTPPPAPTVTRTSPSSTPTSQTAAQIDFSANEAGGTLECSVDGGSYAACAASPANLTGLTDGAHSYEVRQIDAAGNTGTPTSVSWTVDTLTPAAPTVSSNRTGTVNVTTATITFSAAEGGGTMQCSIDGGAYATCAASPISLSALADGNHSYAVRQVDAAGNVGSANTVAWVVDTVLPPAPTVTRVSPVSTPTSQTTAQIAVTANESGGTLECSVDGGAFASCAASPAILSGLTDGPHSYAVRQLDAAGNTSNASSVSWTVDTTPPPAPNVSSNRTGTTNETTAQLTFSANEAGGTLQCSVDGGAYSSCGSSPNNINSLADGNHSYSVRQVDAAGNTGSATTVAWIVDTVAPPAPNVTRTSPASTPTNNTDAEIAFSANEAGGTLECSVDGGAYAPCAASPASLSGLIDGAHSYAVRQVDAGGNTGISTTVNWIVDTLTPAAPTVSSNRTGTVNVDTATITYAAAEAGGTMQCSIDGGAFAACAASPIALSSLADGVHSYAVRQVDAAGNTGSAASVAWIVDTVAPPAPTVTRTSPTATPTNQTTAQIPFSANEAGGALECAVDGGSYAPCGSSPANLSGLTDGPHSYSVRQIDAGTNVGAATTVNWTVDTAAPPAPTVTRTSPTSSPTSDTTAEISFSANEAGGTLECSVDGGSFAACGSSPTSLTGLADGPHSYSVRQVDTAGNTGGSTTVSWTVDTAAPPAPSVSANRSGTTSETTAEITFSANEAGGTLECSVDGGVYAACAASPVSLSGLADGSHSYAIRQVDAANNVGSATTVVWIVDTVAPPAPTVTRSSPTSTPTSDTTAEISFSANEAGGTLECSADGGAFAACGSSPASLTGLADGAHSYAVRQVDAGGNTGAASTVSWTVDTLAPAAPTVSSNRTGTVNFDTATITYSAAESGGSIECSVDGGAYATCSSSPISLSALTDGNHSYAVRQIDDAGNVGSASTVAWIVDTVAPPAPTVTRTSPTASPTNQTTAQIDFSANEAGGTLECSVDGGAYATCAASPANLNSLADGAHSYAVRQVDGGGNVGAVASVSWTVDTADPPAPTVTRTSPTSTPTSQTTAQIDFSANEAGGTLECSVDGGAYSTCGASPASLSALTDGAHSYAARQVDAAGNTGPAAIVNWTVDTAAPPAPNVSSNRTGTTDETTAELSFSANEAGGTLECSVDGGAFTVCGSSPASLTGLTDGPHSYAVRQVDAAGNTGSTTTVSWTVDTVDPPAPSVSLDSPTTSPTSDTTAEISFAANEPGGALECSVDGGAYAACGSSPATLAGLADGAHSYAVRQVDAGGNDGAATTVNWTVDTSAPAAPTVTIDSPASSPSNDTSAQISYSGAEPGGTFECSVDGGAFVACASSPISLSALSDGPHSYAVRQIDAAGNTGATTTVNWTVDTAAPSAPTVVLDAPTSSPSSDTTAQISYAASEPGGTLECSVDGGAYAACASSPATLTGLSDGPHSYAVRQVDAAGNTGSVASTAWIVDTTAPVAPTVTRTAPATTPTSDTAAEIDFAANESGGTLECSVDGGTYATCGSSPASLSGLADGAHSYAVRQVDAAGNTGATGTVNWTVDTAAPPAPPASLDSPAASPTSDTNAEISFAANEPGGTLECSVDSGAYVACGSSPATLTGLTDGPHSYSIRQVDAAGNTGSATSVAWAVDTLAPAAPTVTRTSPTTTPTAQTTAEIAFSASEAGGTLECSVDGGAYAPCGSSPATLSGLSDGSHSYAVRQLDDAGNVGASASVSWTVDTAAPDAPTVNSNRTGTVSESTATITFSASEPGGSLECALDGGAFAPCGISPVELTGLTDGPHSYSVRQLDDAGNAASATTVAWIVDLTAPGAPTITTPATSPSYSAIAQPMISGTAEPESTVRIYDGAVLVGTGLADVNGGWTITTDALNDGPHTITATSRDAAGNTSSASAGVTIVVDTTAPTVAISAPANGSYVNTPEVVVNFSVTDANPSTSSLCQVDSGSFVSCTSGFTTAALAPGAHTVTVQHVDRAGNIGSSSTTFTVDSSTPQVFITSPASFAHVATATPTVLFNVVDDNPGVSSLCSVDGGPTTGCTNAFEPSALSEGSHTVTVSHTDAGGNTGNAAVTFTVDTTNPTAPTITDAPATPIASDEATFEFSGNEVGGTFTCSLDGAAATPCTSPITYSGLADGPHNFEVRQVDLAGNTGPADTHDWTVDTTPPAAPSVTGPNPQTNNPESTVSFTGSPDTVTMLCSFDSGAPTTCPTSPLSLGELPDGSHSFTVQAFDAAGNSSSSTVTWVIDTVAPGAPTIISGPIGATPSPDASFAFTGAESGGLFRCQLGSQPAVTCTSPFEYTGMADDTYTFRVRQVDDAGNVGPSVSRTWTVDTTPPSTPTVTGPTSPSGLTSAMIDFSIAESGVTFQCQLDSGAYSPCVDPLSLSGLADGPHTVNVRAYDAAGNGSAAGSYTWTVDSSLFTADISGAPTGVVSSTGATMTLTASLAGSTFECSLDGVSFAACTSPVTVSGLAEGAHNFRARAKNGAQTSPAVTRSWTVDLTNPGVSISAPAPASTTGPGTNIVFTTSDLNAPVTTTCKLDSAAAAPCTSPHAYANLLEGNRTVTVVATDAAGNSASAVVTWHVDHTAPAAPLITQPSANGSTSDATPTIGGSAEANSTVTLYEGSTLVAMLTANGSGGWSWTPPSDYADGTYNFTATSTDQFDNESVSSATRAVTVDTAAPAAPIVTAPTAGPTNDSTPSAAGSAEPDSSVTVFVDGNPVPGSVTVDGSGNWQKLISPALSDGPHTITAVSTDGAGNASPASAAVAITVDTSAPSVAITSPVAASDVNTASPAVNFTAESGAITRCKIDGGAFAACTSPYTPASLTEGSHTVTVEATDSAGNVATAVVTFTVDLTDPTAQLTGGPAEGAESSDDTPTFTFTSNEPGSFECSIDSGAFGACSSPFTLPVLGDGTHSFTVRSVDDAGNTSNEITRSWTVDTTAPGAPSIDSPTSSAVIPDSTPTVSGNAGSAEAGATLSVYINGTLNGTTTVNPDGSWSHTISPALGDNTYAITARATDEAGNQSALSNVVNVRIDASDPTADITAHPGALSNDSTPTFSFNADEPGTFECRINGGAFAPCASPLTAAALPDGAHQFAVRAIDAGGNTSAVETWDWTIDTTAPIVTVSSNTPAAGVSPTFSFSSSESGTTYRCRIDGSGVFATCSSPFNAPTLPAGSHTLEVQFTDPAGNTGTETVNFTVSAPTQPTPPVTPTPPAEPTPPTAPTCTGSGDEPGIPANMTVLKASAKKNVIKFTTSSDKYILIRVSIYSGKKRIGTSVRANNPGKRIVAIKMKKALPKNKKYTVRLAAITMSGGKSVAGTDMVTDKKGKTTLVGADGKVGAPPVSSIDCAPEKGAKKIKVKVASAVKVKIGVKKLTATATASDWAVATFRIIQNGKTVGRRVFLLKPGKKLKAPIKLLAGKKLVKGKATVQVATCSVDGVWQLFKKQITVK